MPHLVRYRETYRMFRDIERGALGMTTTTDGDGPLDTSTGYPEPGAFVDGDEIDSAAVDEDPDGYEQPADPDAEPAAHPGDDTPGGDD